MKLTWKSCLKDIYYLFVCEHKPFSRVLSSQNECYMMHFQVAAGSARVPADFLWGDFPNRMGKLPIQFRSSYLKISQIFGTRVSFSISLLHCKFIQIFKA